MKFNTSSLRLLVLLLATFGVKIIFGQSPLPAATVSPLIGDYKTSNGSYYMQVYVAAGQWKANLVTDPVSRKAPVAVLNGIKVNEQAITLSGDGWEGKIENEKLQLSKGTEKLEMKRYYRTSPTLNAAPPKGAIVLYDGKNVGAWKKVLEKDWLEGTTPADNFTIMPDGALQVVPHAAGLYESLITKQQFGDLHLHVEFRLQGEVTNGGVYLMSRYEINIKDAFGSNAPIAFGNIAKPSITPDVNVAFPPMQWQTFDIDFKAPRFDATGKQKIENARVTLVHNGVLIYDNVAIEEVKGSTAKLGEAGIGPVYLQEHGNAYQFRNIWVIDKTVKGTENYRTATAVAATAEEGDMADGATKGKGGKSGGKKGGGKKNGTGKKMSETDTATATAQDQPKKKGGSSKKNKEADYDGEKNPAYAAVTVVLTADVSGKPAPAAGFIHPGVLMNGNHLEEIRRRVKAGVEPQKTAFEKMKASPLGALDYVVQPRDTVSCGPYSKPNLGCKEEQNDCAAAYTQALLWYITGQEAYAKNAIKIMDQWATNLVGGHNYANGPVQAAWCGSVWPRAAEIIRYTYKKWPDASIARFQNMLRTQYLPSIIHGDCENGNKELAMSEALINIGVFNDDRAVYDLGVKMWRGRTPAYIYLKTDGDKPVTPPGCGEAIWSNKGYMPELVDGLLQESARDSHHPWMAFASMVNAAETARQQGLDLYAEEGKRMMAALEFEAQYLKPNNTPAPPNMEFGLQPTWEIAYNHFHNRMGYKLPKMALVLPTNRPTEGNHHMYWETLTHAEIGTAGLTPVKK